MGNLPTLGDTTQDGDQQNDTKTQHRKLKTDPTTNKNKNSGVNTIDREWKVVPASYMIHAVLLITIECQNRKGHGIVFR